MPSTLPFLSYPVLVKLSFRDLECYHNLLGLATCGFPLNYVPLHRQSEALELGATQGGTLSWVPVQAQELLRPNCTQESQGLAKVQLLTFPAAQCHSLSCFWGNSKTTHRPWNP